MNDTSKMDYNKSIEFNGDVEIRNIHRYKHVPGVWGVLGKNDKGWEWVTIASTRDIGAEISQDVLFMMKDVLKRGTKYVYTNYWRKILFEYRIFNRKKIKTRNALYLERRKALWAYIASIYEDFCFVCLVENESNEKIRLSKEKYIATKTKAKFWNDLDKSSTIIQYKELNKVINSINEKYNIKTNVL